MAIDGNTGEIITLEEAIDFTHSFQEKNPHEIKAFFAGINKLNLILKQEDCIGVRFYHGFNDHTGKTDLVLVGVDKNGEDLTHGIILERLNSCPNDCAKSSPLMK